MEYLQKPYICIEGVIGAGKTSLCRLLAETENCLLILEEFDENPFLQAFYDNPSRYAFPVELFFMNERINQLTSTFAAGDLFIDYYLADYFFPKTSIFAQENLSPAESRLFKSLFHQLSEKIPSPNLLVYLARPVDALMANIKKRGRVYESNISPDYLKNLDSQYRQYFNSITDYKVVIYHMEDVDIYDERFLNHLKSLIHGDKTAETIYVNPSDFL